jgi:hypothetical protein
MNPMNQLMRDLEQGVPPENAPNVFGWARPFEFGDPASLPQRKWIYEPHYIRGFTSLTVAPGGVGKSTLAITEAIAIATGRPLLGITPSERTKVWYWNGEDPQEEIQRRVHAVLQHHHVPKEEVEGWLFVGSGRDRDLVLASQDRHGTSVCEPDVQAIIKFARAEAIGVIIIDPFVSTHRVAENDNSALDRVAKAWARVAEEAQCAIGIVHHTRKPNGQAITVDDARGASALLAAARHGRTLEVMSAADADQWGIERDLRRSFVRIESGKANLRPSARERDWLQLVGVFLPNGDEVQAVQPWSTPTEAVPLSQAEKDRVLHHLRQPCPTSDVGWRENAQSRAWAGNAVMDALGLSSHLGIHRAKRELERLLQAGDIIAVNRPFGGKGKTAMFIEVAGESFLGG